MDKRRLYLIFTTIIMLLFAVYVRAGIDRTAQPPEVPGPAIPHGVEGAFADCLNCHAGIRQAHADAFGEFDNCFGCHAQK